MASNKTPAKAPADIGAKLLEQALSKATDPKVIAELVGAAAANPAVIKFVERTREKLRKEPVSPVVPQIAEQMRLVEEAIDGYAQWPELEPPLEAWRKRVAQLRYRAPLVDGLVGKQHDKAVKGLLRDGNALLLEVSRFGLADDQPKRRSLPFRKRH